MQMAERKRLVLRNPANKSLCIELSNQNMCKGNLFFGILVLLIAGCTSGTHELKPTPSESKTLLLYSGPYFGLRRFTFTGIAFLGDRLFAGSERGLYEVIDGRLTTRFNWMPEWDVAENPFYDRVNGYLWFEHTGVGKLIRFDGENWSFVPLPGEERSRGDALAGFQMFNSINRLYAYSPQGIWQWDEAEGWRKQYLNGLNCAGERPGEREKCFLMAGAMGDDLLTVIRHDASLMSVLLPDKPNNTRYDQVCILTKGVCTDVPNPMGYSFFVKGVASGVSRAYVLTYQNELFSVGSNGLEQLQSPGTVDKILQTNSEKLLVALVNGEILEFNGEWKKMTAKPLVSEGSKKIAYLAEHDGKIGYAISGYDLTVLDDCSIRGQSSLWVINGEQNQCVGF